jgi:hypothetical protein
MATQWNEVWEFNTARFRIVGEVTDCDTSPEDHFEFPEDIEAIESGRVAWFDARVRVILDGDEVGADYLGCCAYNHPAELFRHHASYARELRDLRKRHASVLSHVAWLRANRPWLTAQMARELADCAKIRSDIAEVRKILRNNESLKPRVVYCEYGPDMVRQAIHDARVTLARHASAKLRT